MQFRQLSQQSEIGVNPDAELPCSLNRHLVMFHRHRDVRARAGTKLATGHRRVAATGGQNAGLQQR